MNTEISRQGGVTCTVDEPGIGIRHQSEREIGKRPLGIVGGVICFCAWALYVYILCAFFTVTFLAGPYNYGGMIPGEDLLLLCSALLAFIAGIAEVVLATSRSKKFGKMRAIMLSIAGPVSSLLLAYPFTVLFIGFFRDMQKTFLAGLCCGVVIGLGGITNILEIWFKRRQRPRSYHPV